MVKLKANNLVGYFPFFYQISYIMIFFIFVFSYFERGIITCFIVALFRLFFYNFMSPEKSTSSGVIG